MASQTYLPTDPGFGVYVHWPFCLSKCPYCDFNSHVRANPIDEERFVAAYRTELAHRAALTKGRKVASVFFGGGTPSLMKPETVSAILEAIAKHWTIAARRRNHARSQSDQRRGGAFSRLSLCRRQSRLARRAGLERRRSEGARASAYVAEALPRWISPPRSSTRYSFDLIYARPGQSAEAWKRELQAALAHVNDHLSLYQLTIEPDTMFERLRDAGKLDPAQCR